MPENNLTVAWPLMRYKSSDKINSYLDIIFIKPWYYIEIVLFRDNLNKMAILIFC